MCEAIRETTYADSDTSIEEEQEKTVLDQPGLQPLVDDLNQNSLSQRLRGLGLWGNI